MEKINDKRKSNKLSRTKTISAGTIGMAAFLTATFLVSSYIEEGYFHQPQNIAQEVEEDSEILLLDAIEKQITFKEVITPLELKEKIMNTINVYKEEKELSSDVGLALMVLNMRIDNAIEKGYSLDETIEYIHPALIDGYALKGKVIGKTKEEVEASWGLGLALKN